MRKVLLVLLLILISLAGYVYFTVRRSFPQTDGEIRIAGLRSRVEVLRDAAGVPHIYAANSHDLFMAQGFLHAQDRFWQMDFWRHIGSGQLSEMFGASQLQTDKFLRTLGWRRVVEREWLHLDETSRAILNSYSEGVNAYLNQHQGSELSLEYAILGLLNRGYKPQKWLPVHSLTWGKVMAWDLSMNMDYEIYRSVLAKSIGREKTEQLFPPYPVSHPFIVGSPSLPAVPSVKFVDPPVPPVPAQWLAELANHPFARPLDATIGSNSWVVAGSKTATGKPLLANDTHLGVQMPSIWYGIALHCLPQTPDCRFDVAGFSFAGVPGVIIGHNEHVAWGLTNLGPDVMDLYIEKTHPAKADQYEHNGQWKDMEIVNETIRVANGDPVPLRVRYTRHGPVISDTYSALKEFPSSSEFPQPFALALRWTALDIANTFPAIWRANLARNWHEFRDAMRSFEVPSQNIVYADVEGNIAYQSPGEIPIRPSVANGRYPAPGWTDEYDWQGFIPFEELPHELNPERGYVVSANNAVIQPQYRYLLATDWDYGFRAARITEMLEATNEKLKLSDMQRMHGDNKNKLAEVYVPLLLQIDWNNARLNEMISILRDWNFQNHMDLTAPTLFEGFWKHLLMKTFQDDLPQQYWPAGGGRWALVAIQLASQPEANWWDNKNTHTVEQRNDILRTAFTDSVKELETMFGKDATTWQWGRAHITTFRNETLGQSGYSLIERLFNRGPFPTSGGNFLVNATSWNARSSSFEVTHLPALRMIADPSDWNNSLAIHTTGQSGHSFHPHYIDLADKWRRIEYYPMPWDRDRVQAAAKHRLILVGE